MNYRIKWLSSVCYATVMLAVVTSCAEGFDNNEHFSAGAGVTNAQLEAPKLEPENLQVQTSSSGAQSVDVSWPVVYGAGGYLANVNIVNDPANPIPVVTDSVIDGCHFSFPREVDTKYEITVKTLGNEQLNNTGSADASSISYSTMLPATLIPVGVEISQFIADNLPAGSTEEIAFELAAGATYQLSGNADMKLANVTIRGDRYSRPLVVLTEQGGFTCQSGITLRNINFDLSEAGATSLVSLSSEPDAMFSTEALGYKALSDKVKDGFVVPNPVSIESCNMRNLPSSIFYSGKVNGGNSGWALTNFRIDNCVVQFKKANAKPAINMEDNWGFSLIKTMVLSNSTFYNLADYKCRFIRYGVRFKPEQAFGPGVTCEHNLSHSTFYKTFTGDQFANNFDQTQTTVNLDHCIFYDINRLDQYCFRSGTYYTAEDNVSWLAGSEASLHSNVKKISEEVDPEFTGPTALEFDLQQTNGGVSFHPQAAICIEKKIGDPRWLE